jgi:hypothetical protein
MRVIKSFEVSIRSTVTVFISIVFSINKTMIVPDFHGSFIEYSGYCTSAYSHRDVEEQKKLISWYRKSIIQYETSMINILGTQGNGYFFASLRLSEKK